AARGRSAVTDHSSPAARRPSDVAAAARCAPAAMVRGTRSAVAFAEGAFGPREGGGDAGDPGGAGAGGRARLGRGGVRPAGGAGGGDRAQRLRGGVGGTGAGGPGADRRGAG